MAMGLFSSLTRKSGEDLEKYKKDLLTLNATFAGGLSLIGRTAKFTGIYNRNVISKVA